MKAIFELNYRPQKPKLDYSKYQNIENIELVKLKHDES